MVPEGWEVKRFGELAKINMGQSPDSEFVNEQREGIAFLQGNAEFGAIYPSEKYWVTEPKKVAEAGEILVSVRAPVGEINRANQSYCIGRGLASLKINKHDPEYGYFAFSLAKNQLNRLAQGSTFLAISKDDLNVISILVPPKSEQQKIATILSTLDRTIEATQKMIDKEKMVKKGLMADLLTHGIDEQGRIRSPQTHTYVNSPLGMIPEGWEVKALAQCAEIMNSNIDKKSHAEEQAIRLCNYMDVYSNEEITNAIDFMQATATDSEIKKFLLKKNDVIITKDSESPDDIGIAAYVTQNFDDVLCGYHLTLLRPKKNCVGQYLSKALQSDHCIKYFGKVASGSTRYALSIGAISNTKIIFPPMKEQQRIATILSVHDRKIETEETNLDKLQNLKKGLMEDLLSGKVRVKV